MNTRGFFYVSLALAIGAIWFQGKALRQFSRGAQAIARAAPLSDSARGDARLEAKVLVSRGESAAYVGIGFAVVSLVFLVVSARRHEPAWWSVPFALLVFYLMMHFMLV